MNRKTRAWGWLALCAIAMVHMGCATPPPARISVPFDQTRARMMLEPGNNQIQGTALLWLSTGGVISCAGDSVTLYPVTAYARQWVLLNYGSVPPAKLQPIEVFYRPRSAGPSPVVPDPGFLSASRTVKCDDDAHFSFDQIGDGEYLVVAHLVWQQQIWDEVNFFYGNNYYGREGTVVRQVRVRGGQRVIADMKWSVPNSRFNLW